MPDLTPQTETLRGELLDLRLFRNHWGIAQVAVKGEGTVTATGKALGVEVGDFVSMVGEWQDDPKWGRQFRVRQFDRLNPEGSAGAIRWIASRCPNVGENRARQMVERFGDDLWQVIEENPLELCTIKGITAKRAGEIAEAYAEHRAERDAMVALRGWQLSEHQVAQCVEAWGSLDRVVAALREDPYALCQHVAGFGFLRADKIARAMGVPPDAPARIAAGVGHVLAEARGAGHCFVGGGALRRRAAELLGLPESDVVPELRAARDRGAIICDGAKGWRVYSPALHRAETSLASRLRVMLGAA